MSDDTSDIVERLRRCAAGELCPSVADEGADEIEMLRSNLAFEQQAARDMQADRDGMREDRDRLLAEAERLKKALEACHEIMRAYEDARMKWEGYAENERLRSILEQIAAMPFAPHNARWPQEVAKGALQQVKGT